MNSKLSDLEVSVLGPDKSGKSFIATLLADSRYQSAFAHLMKSSRDRRIDCKVNFHYSSQPVNVYATFTIGKEERIRSDVMDSRLGIDDFLDEATNEIEDDLKRSNSFIDIYLPMHPYLVRTCEDKDISSIIVHDMPTPNGRLVVPKIGRKDNILMIVPYDSQMDYSFQTLFNAYKLTGKKQHAVRYIINEGYTAHTAIRDDMYRDTFEDWTGQSIEYVDVMPMLTSPSAIESYLIKLLMLMI